MKKTFMLLSAACLLCAACAVDNAETEGERLLAVTRQLLSAKQYDAARDSIMALRSEHPTAIQARRQAILLLDSIELFAAQDSLQYADSLEWERLDIKAKFFERKLQEDQKR